MCPESNLVPALTSQRWVFWVLKTIMAPDTGEVLTGFTAGMLGATCSRRWMSHGRTKMQKWVQDCEMLCSYHVLNQQSPAQHTAQSHTHNTAEPDSAHAAVPHSQQQSPAPHTPQRHTHNSRAQLRTRRSATLTTQQRPAWHTAQRYTHDTAEAAVWDHTS